MKLNENFRWIIGLVISVILAVVALFYPSLREEKELSFRIIGAYTNFDKNDLPDKKIVILADSTPIDRLQSTIIEFVNTGDEPIKSADFESDLQLFFDGSSTVISATFSNAKPKTLPIKLNYRDSLVSVKPLLLNKGDRFVIQVFTTGQLATPRIECRVVGLNELTEQTTTELSYNLEQWQYWLIGMLLYCCSAMFIALALLQHPNLFQPILYMAFALVTYMSGMQLCMSLGWMINEKISFFGTIVLTILFYSLSVWLIVSFFKKGIS